MENPSDPTEASGMDTSPWRELDALLDWQDTTALVAATTRRSEWLRNTGAGAEVAQRFALYSVHRARDAAVDALTLGGWETQANQLASSSEPATIHNTVLRIDPPIAKAASKAVRRMKKGGPALDHASLTGGVALALSATGGAADLLGEPYSDAATAGVSAAVAACYSGIVRFFATPFEDRVVDMMSLARTCQNSELETQAAWLADNIEQVHPPEVRRNQENALRPSQAPTSG